MIELWREDIEIEIQHTVLTRDISHVLIYLVLVLYADHGSDESRLDRWDYIVPDITRQIRKVPSILLILDGFREIERMCIIPEVGVLIDMYQFESWLYASLSHCVTPEVERMVVVIEDSDWWDSRIVGW